MPDQTDPAPGDQASPAPQPRPPGKSARTRRALADAAVSLFSERGYEAVTMEEVALAAGVSRRTAFRHFPNKSDLAMEYSSQWWEVFEQALSAVPDADLETRLRTGSYAVAAHIQSDPVAVKQLLGLAFASPALTARYAESTQEWIARIAAEVGRGLDGGSHADVRANILGAAFMGMINSVSAAWAIRDEPMEPLLDVGFDLLEGSFAALERGLS